jgi:L-lactate dehydrogenase complex protein LldG
VSDARAGILARLPGDTPAAPPATAARRALDAPGRRRAFVDAARSAAATVAEVRAPADVAGAVRSWLAAQGLPDEAWVSGGPAGLDATADGPAIRTGPMPADGATVVTGCLALLAREGAVVLASGAGHATESAFLAASHVVVAPVERLVDDMDALWPLLRARGEPPRTLNIVRGPSRTADLGVPSRLGAHGPLRVHVILVGEDAA